MTLRDNFTFSNDGGKQSKKTQINLSRKFTVCLDIPSYSKITLFSVDKLKHTARERDFKTVPYVFLCFFFPNSNFKILLNNHKA